MPGVCLCMIVKDESRSIELLLRSALPVFDTWLICDTGSTDGTQDLIRRTLSDVPGELHERPWQDFGHNRSEALALAHGNADWLLLLDADMVLEQTGPLPELTADAYLLRHEGTSQYWVPRLLRGDLPWRYVGATHEYLDLDRSYSRERLAELVIHHHGKGGAKADKFERDERLLRKALERDPTDRRSLFYLAQTLRDVGRVDEALGCYEQRAALDGWIEETFYAQYQVGVLHVQQGRWREGLAALLSAWQMRPERLEPVYALLTGMRDHGLYEPAYALAAQTVDQPPPDDILFVERWIWKYGILVELSIAAFNTGRVRESLAACNRLLAMEDLPPAHREHTKRNRRLCLDAASPLDDSQAGA
jgi:tetratricopeptide (TPR) repeat protein